MGEIITKKKFSPQSEPHTAKLCFSVVLNFFWEIHREALFLLKKWRSQKGALKSSESFFFS